MNRSTTLNIEVLQAASKATKACHCRLLVVKLTTNTNAGGASITTTNADSQNIFNSQSRRTKRLLEKY